MDKKKVAVIGIGRVGLPFSLVLCEAGYHVQGIDVREEYVAGIKQGKMPFREENGQELLNRHVAKNFFPGTDIAAVKACDSIVLTLGTPVDEHLNPDYKQLDNVLEKMTPLLQKGQLIILRSTVAPGTTEYVKGYIETHAHLKVGKDIFLAFCPERIAQGHGIREAKEIPEIAGGIDAPSTAKAVEFLKAFSREQLPTDSRSAELAKILTNMFRYINFSIANEFMILAEEHERDIHEILHLINHNYKRGGVKLPGYTAGPCLYKDGFFLVNTLPFSELISVSGKINETTPLYLLKKLKEKTGLKNKKVALLGMAFKADNDDTRQSLSFKIKKALEREQALVQCHDPFVPEYCRQKIEDVISNADVVIIAMNHSSYRESLSGMLEKHGKKDVWVCDIWNLLGRNKVIFQVQRVEKT